MKNLMLLICGLFTLSSCLTENGCKKYVIKHKSEIIRDTNIYMPSDPSIYYKINKCDYKYYTDITIKLISDSTYYIIFWGDRNSLQWDLRLDKYFEVDVPYNRCKGKNTKLDEQILEILKNK